MFPRNIVVLKSIPDAKILDATVRRYFLLNIWLFEMYFPNITNIEVLKSIPDALMPKCRFFIWLSVEKSLLNGGRGSVAAASMEMPGSEKENLRSRGKSK